MKNVIDQLRAAGVDEGAIASAVQEANRPQMWDRVSIGGIDVRVSDLVYHDVQLVLPRGVTSAVFLRPAPPLPSPPPDPRLVREQRRREIDAVLREDARRFPAFATARKCAVVAGFEECSTNAETLSSGVAQECPGTLAAAWLKTLHEYEAARGCAKAPSREVRSRFRAGAMIAAYERARSLP